MYGARGPWGCSCWWAGTTLCAPAFFSCGARRCGCARCFAPCGGAAGAARRYLPLLFFGAAGAFALLSLHAPYFINLSTDEAEKKQKNIGYVLESCRAARDMGADRIVVHTGGVGKKRTRDAAMANSRVNVREILAAKEDAGYTDITICLETMGKINVIGTAQEIMELVALDDRLLPCIDFGHLNARTHGEMATREEVAALFDLMEQTIGIERAKIFHSHFSKIEYSKGGEVRHLTFSDEIYGPPFEPIAAETAARGYTPRFICESAGTQAEDAVTMMHIYQNYMKQTG